MRRSCAGTLGAMPIQLSRYTNLSCLCLNSIFIQSNNLFSYSWRFPYVIWFKRWSIFLRIWWLHLWRNFCPVCCECLQTAWDGRCSEDFCKITRSHVDIPTSFKQTLVKGAKLLQDSPKSIRRKEGTYSLNNRILLAHAEYCIASTLK